MLLTLRALLLALPLAMLLVACGGAGVPAPGVPSSADTGAAGCAPTCPTPQSAIRDPQSGGLPVGIYHVAPDGDDAGPGTADQPWRTIQRAADALLPGEGALAHAGTYHEAIVVRRGGLFGARLTLAAAPGETVVLDGQGRLDSAFALAPGEPGPGVSHITLLGFTIQHYTGFGIVAPGIHDALVLQNLVITDNGDAGIRLSNSHGTLVQNVTLRGNQGGFDCTPILPGGPDDPGCTTLVLRDVVAEDNGTEGDTAVDAFAVERGSGIVFERCRAAGGPGDGFDVKADNAHLRSVVAHGTRNNVKLWGRNSTLSNALLYDATADANVVLAAGGSYTLTHVTIANMTDTAYLVTVGGDGPGPTPVSITSAILANDNPANEGTLLYLGADARPFALQNILFFNPYRDDAVLCLEGGRCYGAADLEAGVGPSPGLRTGDPRFANPTAGDFRLLPDSPALAAGSPIADPNDVLATDLAGCRRPAAPALGAYEQADCMPAP